PFDAASVREAQDRHARLCHRASRRGYSREFARVPSREDEPGRDMVRVLDDLMDLEAHVGERPEEALVETAYLALGHRLFGIAVEYDRLIVEFEIPIEIARVPAFDRTEECVTIRGHASCSHARFGRINDR